MTKDELLAILRLCNADLSSIDAVELAYELGFKAGQAENAWRNAAIRIGEDLSSVGPDGYYDMSPDQWLDWAMNQQPRGKDSLPVSPSTQGRNL